ncbi:GIY-YIG nuclease family protein [Nonomuraea sp. MTCD27]|uniref:GIY-YIG nuclease family protein n=1 Tax=Nonomuraea sp. MTCD27 TaxID=1676747 RepID=UPI0035C09FE9
MTQPTTLYRLYDTADRLLYVGVAGNPGRRFEQHRAEKPWWGQVARITLEHHPTREAALDAELTAIRTENPRHNIAGRADQEQPATPGWEHRLLPNGAYLDTEHRGDHIRVYINRDDLALELHYTNQPYAVPARVAAVHERLAAIAAHWLWAHGLAHDEDIAINAGRWRAVSVAPTNLLAAQQALVASELRGDTAEMERLSARLIATFPTSEGWMWTEALRILSATNETDIIHTPERSTP